MATTPKKQRGHTPGKSAAPTTRGNDTALVHLRGNELVTDSLTISGEFCRRHDNVLRTLDSLIADGTIDLLNYEETSYLDESNRKQRMIVLDERGALIAMPFTPTSKEGEVITGKSGNWIRTERDPNGRTRLPGGAA